MNLVLRRVFNGVVVILVSSHNTTSGKASKLGVICCFDSYRHSDSSLITNL